MPNEHFHMGAENKTTKEYIFPIHAHKNCNYRCPKCKNDILFRNGKINAPHFAHKKKSNCCYYSNPTESEIHKEGKRLIKNLLDSKEDILVYRHYKCCNKSEKVFSILNGEYTEQINCVEEFSFVDDCRKKYADVALLNGMNIEFIFEIFHTHRTSEKRQTKYKWCEIDATKFINETMKRTNVNEDGQINIQCVRDIKCKECMLRKFVNANDIIMRNIICSSWWKLKNKWLDWKKLKIFYLSKLRYKYRKLLRSSWQKLKNKWLDWKNAKREMIIKNKIKNMYNDKEKEYQEKIKRIMGGRL